MWSIRENEEKTFSSIGPKNQYVDCLVSPFVLFSLPSHEIQEYYLISLSGIDNDNILHFWQLSYIFFPHHDVIFGVLL